MPASVSLSSEHKLEVSLRTNFNLCRQYGENQNKPNKTLTTFMRQLKSYLFSQY